jgi:hypothetical protein
VIKQREHLIKKSGILRGINYQLPEEEDDQDGRKGKRTFALASKPLSGRRGRKYSTTSRLTSVIQVFSYSKEHFIINIGVVAPRTGQC